MLAGCHHFQRHTPDFIPQRSLQGNLSAFVEKKPEAKSYYDLKEASIKFTLPEPGFLEGVKSKDRAILKMHSVGYTCAFGFCHAHFYMQKRTLYSVLTRCNVALCVLSITRDYGANSS